MMTDSVLFQLRLARPAKMNMLPEPPQAIIDAAYEVSNWAEQQLPFGHWEIGPVCSRNHAHHLKSYDRLIRHTLGELLTRARVSGWIEPAPPK